MDCNIIRDLIPLYVDECCTQESIDLVQEHLTNCKACQRVYSAMKTPAQIPLEIKTPKMRSHRINDWKASVLQSMLLYLSFGLIALGVMLEAATPNGLANGLWAYALVVPATANLFALANWYFIRLYKSKKAFSNCSGLITVCSIYRKWIRRVCLRRDSSAESLWSRFPLLVHNHFFRYILKHRSCG